MYSTLYLQSAFFCFRQVFNAQLVPENTELITDIIFPEVFNAQVIIPANAIIHQRTVERMYVCITHNVT